MTIIVLLATAEAAYYAAHADAYATYIAEVARINKEYPQ